MANNDWNVKMHVDFDVNSQTAKMCIAMLNIYLADNPDKGIAIYTDGLGRTAVECAGMSCASAL